LFDGETQMHFSMFETICGAMREDERIETCATCCWEGGLKLPGAVVAELLTSNTRFVPYHKAKWRKWDLYVSSCFDVAWLARTAPWVDTFHGVGEKWTATENRLYMVHPLAARYDKLLCPNQRLADQFQEHPEFVKTQEALRVTGMPRSDLLVWLNTKEVRSALHSQLRLKPGAPTVLLSPTYGTDGLAHKFGVEIIEECLRSGVNLIVKLHSCSYLADPRFNGGVDWAERLAKYKNHEGFLHAPYANLTALMLLADIMIADFGSAPVEFSLLDRPLVFFAIDEQAKLRGGDRFQYNLLCSAGGNVATTKQLAGILALLTKGEDPRTTERSKLKGHFFHQPGSATANALKEMYHLMGLTVPGNLVEKYLERKKAEVLANPGRFLGLPEDAIPAGMPPAHVNDFSVSSARLQEFAQELSAYNGTPVDQVAARLQEELHGLGGRIAAEWCAKRPVTSGQIQRFYQETDAYLYELLIDGENPFRDQTRDAMMHALHKIGARRVFEFGGGIGTDAMWFTRAGLQWTYYDLPRGQTSRFASWRFQKQQVPITVVTHPSQSRENDAAISVEVFEHLPNLLGALRDINRALRPGGLLIFTESFGKTKRHPLHLSRATIQGRFLNELMRAAGFEPVHRFGPEDCLYRTIKRRDPTPFDWLHAIVLIAGRVAHKLPAKLWRALSQRSPVTHGSGS